MNVGLSRECVFTEECARPTDLAATLAIAHNAHVLHDPLVHRQLKRAAMRSTQMADGFGSNSCSKTIFPRSPHPPSHVPMRPRRALALGLRLLIGRHQVAQGIRRMAGPVVQGAERHAPLGIDLLAVVAQGP